MWAELLIGGFYALLIIFGILVFIRAFAWLLKKRETQHSVLAHAQMIADAKLCLPRLPWTNLPAIHNLYLGGDPNHIGLKLGRILGYKPKIDILKGQVYDFFVFKPITRLNQLPIVGAFFYYLYTPDRVMLVKPKDVSPLAGNVFIDGVGVVTFGMLSTLTKYENKAIDFTAIQDKNADALFLKDVLDRNKDNIIKALDANPIIQESVMLQRKFPWWGRKKRIDEERRAQARE